MEKKGLIHEIELCYCCLHNLKSRISSSMA